MLKIRLQRVGRTHEPSFRLVLTDSKNATKSGRFKEMLGSYDPRKTRDLLKSERIKYWLSQGVGVTPTIHNLLVSHKIIDGTKINVAPPRKPQEVPAIQEVKEPKVPEVVQEETSAPESSPVEAQDAAPESSSEPQSEDAIIEEKA